MKDGGGKMSSLYELTDDLAALNELIDQVTVDADGNPKALTPEDHAALAPLVKEIIGNYETKVERIVKWRQSLQAFTDNCKAEEERIYNRRKAAENKITALQWLLEKSMEQLKTKKLTVGTFTLAMQHNPPSVFIADTRLLPDHFWRVIPEQREPDKKEILAALKEGQAIPGAFLSRSESLRIR